MSLLPTSHRLQLMFPPSIVGLFSTLRMPEPREMNITNKGMRLFRSAAIDEAHSEQFWKLWRRCNADFAMCGLKVRRTQGQWYVTQTLLPSGVLDEEDERYYRTLKGDQQAMLALETEIVHFDPPPLPAHLEAMLKEYQIPCARQILYALRTYGGAWDCSDMGYGKTYQTAAAAIAFGKRPAIICPKSVKADWKDTLKKFNVSPLFVETWEAMALGSTPWAKRIGEGIAWNLPDNVIVIADEAQAARHAHVSWAGKMILALARQEIPTICASATIAMSPSEMLATGAIIGLHDGTRDGFARFASNYGCLNTGGTWMFDKRNSSALVRLHRQVFPRRGARGKIETLGDKFPKTEIITRMIDVAQDEREKIIKAYHDAAKVIERLERQGDLRAAKMAGLQQWQKAYHASEMVLVPYIAAMVKEAINEGWHCPVFMNFDDTREKMMETLGTTCTIHGAMNEQQRTHAKALFQSDESPVIVLNLKAGGTGVSLHDTIGNFPRKSFIFPFSQAIKMKQGFGRVQRTNGVTASQQIIPWVTETPQVQICASVRASLANLDSLNDGLLTPKLRF